MYEKTLDPQSHCENKLDPFDNHLDELLHTVLVARANYEIWWIYKNERPQYVDVLNEYIGFFHVGIHAHFVAMLMALYKLGDNRRDSVSVLTLIAEAKKDPSFDLMIIKSAESKFQNLETVWNKVCTLRHKLFAHRDRIVNYEETFKSVAITGEDLKKMTDGFLELLNEFLYYRRKTTLSFMEDTLVDTRKVLNCLNSQM